ncbi:Tat pathway signal sequence domain protein [Cellulophaga sp. BC115SP]|uniref:exo-rhamnogalacturonan lyase family protein n=1 Tax=Cellulophaga sp. BC115SP TaxID=2683263 RepID=UPI001412ADE1|nr:Tat pathway signal sequence domain protein [Cellulophaga sp. BC115SP]NBB29093.1 Tat pathway signal sequence domain protein [Cellulophaga sp. BC115SP]
MQKQFQVSRRDFVKNTLLASTAGTLASHQILASERLNKNLVPVTEGANLHWLSGQAPSTLQGTTWGIPWPKGLVKKETPLAVLQNDTVQNSQTWPLAFWPDGSVKWSAFAIGAQEKLAENWRVKIGQKPQAGKLQVNESQDIIVVDTGKLRCEIAKKGNTIIKSLFHAQQKLVAQNGKLVLQVQNQADGDWAENTQLQGFESTIQKVQIENQGSVRALIKVEGIHQNPQGKQLLPFVLRLYFYENSDSIRAIHSFVYDADENHDFIKGIGFSFETLLKDTALYNRHIRFVGQNGGVFAEAIQGLSGLRRNPGKDVTQSQFEGKSVNTLPQNIQDLLKYIPAFGDYTLFQGSCDGFDIQKRTKSGYGWIQSASGQRASGLAYLGTPTGGLSLGLRHFWQSYPAQIDIRQAQTDIAQMTLWFWAPKASAMDLRFYHDGMGQLTFEEQRDGLDITYEDYEPEFGRPYGTARTSEFFIQTFTATPSHDTLSKLSEEIENPPRLMVSPEQFIQARVFGNAISLPNSSTEKHKAIEEQLAFYFNYYQRQIEERRWYGFWNYGDVMHTYDNDRHVWRYDVGGFAWDNSELSTDLWLWYYFLRTGNKDVFAMAEAMTRHTGEVDVHHIGRFSPLGSRHNVQHWGCSAKQLRISTAANRRFYYYLTADERIGDLMREQINGDKTLREVVPGRKIGQKPPQNDTDKKLVSMSFGTDWGALASAWLTEWERTGNEQIKNKLLNSMRTIATQPKGFFHGEGIMEIATGKFALQPVDKISVSHLSAVFGLTEICFELVDLVDMPEFKTAWLKYCELYNGTDEEQKAYLGKNFKLNLAQGHARLTAFAAYHLKDSKLAQRAWDEFYKGEGGFKKTSTKLTPINPPLVLRPIQEGEVSTNAVAQWGLSAMQCLAYIGNQL